MQKFDDTFTQEHMAEIRKKEEDHLIADLATQNGYGYIDLRGITINPTALFIIPEEDARLGGAVAFETVRKRVSVAVRNPNNQETKKILASLAASDYIPTVFMT